MEEGTLNVIIELAQFYEIPFQLISAESRSAAKAINRFKRVLIDFRGDRGIICKHSGKRRRLTM